MTPTRTMTSPMGCNCGSSSRVVVHESHRPDGTVKRFLSEVEARTDAAKYGGHYAQVVR